MHSSRGCDNRNLFRKVKKKLFLKLLLSHFLDEAPHKKKTQGVQESGLELVKKWRGKREERYNGKWTHKERLSKLFSGQRSKALL